MSAEMSKPIATAPDFSHGDNGLLPAIAQDADTGKS